MSTGSLANVGERKPMVQRANPGKDFSVGTEDCGAPNRLSTKDLHTFSASRFSLCKYICTHIR